MPETPIRIDRVSCTLRRSIEMNGIWTTIEMGAEASVNPKADGAAAQEAIYKVVATDINQRIKSIRNATQ